VPVVWKTEAAAALAALPTPIPLVEVDAHNIAPVWVVSDKKETGARTIRKKAMSALDTFLTEFPPLPTHAPVFSFANAAAAGGGVKLEGGVKIEGGGGGVGGGGDFTTDGGGDDRWPHTWTADGVLAVLSASNQEHNFDEVCTQRWRSHVASTLVFSQLSISWVSCPHSFTYANKYDIHTLHCER
jgi:hypothetical protein